MRFYCIYIYVYQCQDQSHYPALLGTWVNVCQGVTTSLSDIANNYVSFSGLIKFLKYTVPLERSYY